MTILTDEIVFPLSKWASPEGIVAIGGDLSTERILKAYSLGIFPWYNQGSEILWWSPDPRFVLFTKDLKISKSMKQVFKSNKFTVTYDTCFEKVLFHCKNGKRKGQEGTWITNEMEEAYNQLHKMGYAHSVEVWENEVLVGGLYGICLGKQFYGESMFTKVSNASKFGFICLVKSLIQKGFTMIDCQDYTAHLESLGAIEISRKKFENHIQKEIVKEGEVGPWTNWFK
ncbi:MAG: leucyl/phenylalanyl-tRNA--protein transferase [Salibacteraceae bacterium]